MTKVYAFYCDKDYTHVLVGKGGFANYKARLGFHLPGGTVEKKGRPIGKTAAADKQLLSDNLKKETQEEFGRTCGIKLWKELHTGEYSIREHTLNGTKVYFVMLGIGTDAEGLAAFAGKVLDGIGSRKDSSFDEIEVMEINAAKTAFGQKGACTDWFATGCQHPIAFQKEEQAKKH